MKKNTFWVYIIECDNGHYYTGYSVDPVRRYWEHINGKSRAKYTRSFKPKKLARCWRITGAKGDALRVERFIKKSTHDMKRAYIKSTKKLIDALHENCKETITIENSNTQSIEKAVKNYTG